MPPVKKMKPHTKSPKETNKADQKTVVSGQLDKKLKNIVKKQQKKEERKRGVVFIKHLPHGFFEEQLAKYFEQFGNVTRLRLARSKRTGGSKSFAFVEFEYPEVAQVAAETMDNYLMFKKVVKASYIPPEKQCYNYFKTSVRQVKNKAGKDIYVSSKTAAVQRSVRKQNNWSDDAFQKRTLAQLRKANKLKKKYAHLGIDFSKIVLAPKKLTNEERTQKNASIEKSEAVADSSKRKMAKESKKTASKNVELGDLLGNTIIDDSEDEDYIAMASSDESGDDDGSDAEEDSSTSDEETYGFSKDTDDAENDVDSDDDGEEEDENEANYNSNKKITAKSSFGKSLKPKVNRMDELIKRKPLMGGIQKLNKKAMKKPAITKTKTSMQLKSAQELAKPLSSLKGKGAVKAKAGGKKQKKIIG